MNLKDKIRNLLQKYNDSILTITITSIYNKISLLRGKYSLQKEKQLGNIMILNTPQIFDNGYTLLDAKKQREFPQSQIEKFVSQMEDNVSRENLILMYNNLHNLRVNESNASLIMLTLIARTMGTCGIVGGFYDIGKNKICAYTAKGNDFVAKLFRSEKKMIPLEVEYTHELLHMSSTIKKKNKVCSGFNHYYFIPYSKFSVGLALNEGYTDLLNKRIFNHVNPGGVYEIFMIISSMVEDIVGKENMMNLYFSADLKGLIKEMTKYCKENDVKNFIVNFDILHKDPRVITKIIDFLCRAYINKLRKDVEEGKITYIEKKEKLDEFKRQIAKLTEMIKVWVAKRYPRYNDKLGMEVFIGNMDNVDKRRHSRGIVNTFTLSLIIVIVALIITVSYLIFLR